MNKDRTEMGSALTENVAQHLKGKSMVVVVLYVSFLSVSACVWHFTCPLWFVLVGNLHGAEITETLYEASSIFEQILRRKESSDSMRTSLSILHKFRFLFNLPAQIEHNVKAVTINFCISFLALHVPLL